jgi:hypothetical protein
MDRKTFFLVILVVVCPLAFLVLIYFSLHANSELLRSHQVDYLLFELPDEFIGEDSEFDVWGL